MIDESFLNSYRSVIKKSGYEEQKNKGFKARADAKPVILTLPVKWVNKDRNIEFNLSAWRFLPPIWGKLVATGDEQYLFEGVGYIEDWRRHAIEEKKRWSIWYDMATGIRAKHLAFLVEFLNRESTALDGNKKEMIYDLAEEHLSRLRKKENITKGNHAVHQVIGLAHLGGALNVKEAVDFAGNLLLDLVEESFDSNGFCTENSAFYHDYNTTLYAGVNLNLFREVSGQIRGVIKKAREISPWLTNPDGEYFLFGDTEGQGKKLEKGNGHVRQDNFQCLDLHDSGYQVIRTHPDVDKSESTALAFTATNKTHVHDHCDYLAFLLYHRGKNVFTDSGKFTYENSLWRKYFLSDKAHNTVGLKSVTFYPDDSEIGSVSLSPVEEKDEYVELSGSLVRKKYDFSHERKISLDKDFKNIIINDFVKSSGEDCYELRFHLDNDVDVNRESEHEFVFYADNKKIAKLIVDNNANDIAISCGSNIVEPDIGWHSKVYGEKVSSKVIVCHFASESNEHAWTSMLELF